MPHARETVCMCVCSIAYVYLYVCQMIYEYPSYASVTRKYNLPMHVSVPFFSSVNILLNQKISVQKIVDNYISTYIFPASYVARKIG